MEAGLAVLGQDHRANAMLGEHFENGGNLRFGQGTARAVEKHEGRVGEENAGDGKQVLLADGKHVVPVLLTEVDRVGATDNFLLLGGESLSAGQASSRLKEQFGCDISVRSIFVGTVADIAGEITAQLATVGE